MEAERPPLTADDAMHAEAAEGPIGMAIFFAHLLYIFFVVV